MTSKVCSTAEAAKQAGITRQTLQAWIRAGKITPPKPTLDGARAKRLWKHSDVEQVKKVKDALYWTGQGRPKSKGKSR